MGPIPLPTDTTTSMSEYTPHRLLWLSYWGTIAEVTPLHPEQAYELLRKTLKVRRDFTEELSVVKLSLAQRTELLGPERAKVKPEELTAEESAKLAEAESQARLAQVRQLVGDSLDVMFFVIASNRLAIRSRLPTNRRHWFSFALHVAFLAVIAVLAISSFGTLIATWHLLGYPLLLHLTAAGAFVFLLLGFAALYIPQGRPAPDDQAISAHRWWLNRWSIWTLVLAGLVTAGTMFASMLPVLDTAGLLQAATLHRYAGLIVVVAAVTHAYNLVCVRIGWR